MLIIESTLDFKDWRGTTNIQRFINLSTHGCKGKGIIEGTCIVKEVDRLQVSTIEKTTELSWRLLQKWKLNLAIYAA